MRKVQQFFETSLGEAFYKSFLAEDRWQLYIKGIGTTLGVTVIALMIGIAIGIIVAMIRTGHDQQRNVRLTPSRVILNIFNVICKLYVTIIRGTPAIVQLMILGFVVFKSSRNFTMVGALGLGMNSGAYVAEIIRSGLMSVDGGQMEAGRSLGLNYLTTMINIVIPQAIKNILPALANEFIVLLKDTSLISVIAGKELLYAAKSVGAKTYDYMFPLLGCAVVYLIFVIILSYVFGILERRLRTSDIR